MKIGSPTKNCCAVVITDDGILVKTDELGHVHYTDPDEEIVKARWTVTRCRSSKERLRTMSNAFITDRHSFDQLHAAGPAANQLLRRGEAMQMPCLSALFEEFIVNDSSAARMGEVIHSLGIEPLD